MQEQTPADTQRKAELEAALLETHQRFLGTLAGLDDATIEHAPAIGEWPARVVAGHVADWIAEMLLAGEGALAGKPRAPVGDGEAFNQTGVAAHAGEDWPATRQRLDGAQTDAIAFVSRLQPGQLDLELALPWGGHGNLERLISGIAWHCQEHTEELEAWRGAGA